MVLRKSPDATEATPSNVGRRLQVFAVKPSSNGGTVWVKAGSAWVNRDGSLNIFLDVLPLDGKLHVRDALPGPAESVPGTES